MSSPPKNPRKISWLWILSLILAPTGTTTAIVHAPKNIVVHKRTPYFIDIEAPVDRVWMGCTDAGPTLDATSGMMFYVLAGDTAYEFFYRRIYDVRMCLEAERQYRKIVKGEKTIRLVGGHSLKPIVGPQPPSEERIPRRFTAVAKTMSQVFIRLQAGNRCKAYFLEDCELPKNYWAGMMPEPEKK